jgi:translation initiation factor 3 subunit B
MNAPSSFIFIEFNTAEEADRARNVMDRHAFDAKHRFHITLLSDLDDYANMDEGFVEPEPEEFKSKVGPKNCYGCHIV